jgi:hypothetical protein
MLFKHDGLCFTEEGCVVEAKLVNGDASLVLGDLASDF